MTARAAQSLATTGAAPIRLRGDLHAHTLASDGSASVLAMAYAARAAGLEYLAITDHSRYAIHARGLDMDGLARQGEEIDAANAALGGFAVLKGVEVDILEDGTLALSEAVLGALDVVIASVHDHFELTQQLQTARLLRALDHPHVCVLGHPTARLIGERPPIACDWSAVFACARERGVQLELNCQPQRLDLDEEMLREAAGMGVLVSINSDAHSIAGLRRLAEGAAQASRAGLCADQVLNAADVNGVRERLRMTADG